MHRIVRGWNHLAGLYPSAFSYFTLTLLPLLPQPRSPFVDALGHIQKNVYLCVGCVLWKLTGAPRQLYDGPFPFRSNRSEWPLHQTFLDEALWKIIIFSEWTFESHLNFTLQETANQDAFLAPLCVYNVLDVFRWSVRLYQWLKREWERVT